MAVRMSLDRLALPAVIFLIGFLAYGSQLLLFPYLEPHPLKPDQTRNFNSLVICVWITYARACFTDPGSVPDKWPLSLGMSNKVEALRQKHRWCRKCEAFKPPRAHHCKICGRCIPKMDHHCPWTTNCVSHRTFPHFFRFLFYSVVSMVQLEYFLYVRAAVIWKNRNLPIYFGPSLTHMILLFVLAVVTSITLLALGILLARNIWCLGGNVTTIEGWEVERHETLVYRARKRGGYLDGPDGIKIRIKKQEFPYDIGIYQNIKQGIGGNPFLWLWPFAATPSNDSGLDFETNGFEDPLLSWPPPDPDRMPRSIHKSCDKHFTYRDEPALDVERVSAFRRRQQEDFDRLAHGSSGTIFRRRMDSVSNEYENLYGSQEPDIDNAGQDREGWRNSDGDRLDDFGVDENAEVFDEDDVPLGELIRKRQAGSESKYQH